MGGIVLFRKTCQLISGFLCGLLFIEWFPMDFPANLTELFAACVLNPLHFFAASIVFIVGFLTNAELIGGGIVHTVEYIFSSKTGKLPIIFGFIFLFGFFVLFLIGFWQTVMFFCFSFLYGIISIDFKELRLVKV